MRMATFNWKTMLLAAVVATVGILGSHSSALAVQPGAVLKSRSGATLYLVTPARSLAGIPSSEVYNCLGLSGQKHYNVGQDEIDALKKTNLLVRDPEGNIYAIEGTQKRHIVSPAAFEKNGYDQKEVVTISKQKLDCIADGPPVQ